MTNREWLNSLSDKEYVYWLLFTMHKISLGYSASLQGMQEWLKQPFVNNWTNDVGKVEWQ